MGRPIKTAKLINGVPSDTGYINELGLGVVGGDTGTTGKQIICNFRLAGAAYTGWIMRQKGSRKYIVTDGTVTGICSLANALVADGDMTVTVTLPDASTKQLKKIGDTIGITFDDTSYWLTFGSASATPPNGSLYQIAQVESL